jgi:hypothetical protein
MYCSLTGILVDARPYLIPARVTVSGESARDQQMAAAVEVEHAARVRGERVLHGHACGVERRRRWGHANRSE